MNLPSSFDHLVGAGEHRRWHFEAERLCSLEIDHQLELGRRLDRQIARLLAAQQKAEIEKWWPIIKAAGIKAE